MRPRRSLLLLALLALAAPTALGQAVPVNATDTDDTQGLVDEESTLESTPGIAYYAVIAALSFGLLIGLFLLTAQYRKRRGPGSRPPP